MLIHPARRQVSWEAIGGLELQQSQLKRAIVWPLTNPVRFKHFQAASSRGGALMHCPWPGWTNHFQ